LYDDATDELVAEHTTGSGAALASAIRISLGQRLSGWVAANRQTILNSDPALDLGDFARTFNPRLRSCLSAPLIADDNLVGVLSLYSTQSMGFTEDHRRIIEAAARQVAGALRTDRALERDPLTGLPNADRLEELLQVRYKCGGKLSTVFIDGIGLNDVGEHQPNLTPDEALRTIVSCARQHLRATDVLFRCGSTRFVAFVGSGDLATATAIADLIRRSLSERRLPLRASGSSSFGVAITCVLSPNDGSTFRELESSAHVRLSAQLQQQSSQVH
jgi:diguanylate cyclase (GGDEF)-like protein